MVPPQDQVYLKPYYFTNSILFPTLWHPLPLPSSPPPHTPSLVFDAVIFSMVQRSTDSELKLWNVERGQVLRTYRGHTNEKNFVGLSVSNDFISCGEFQQAFTWDVLWDISSEGQFCNPWERVSMCLWDITVSGCVAMVILRLTCIFFYLPGSEDNSVYVYSKQVSKPMLKYKFNTPANLLVRT